MAEMNSKLTESVEYKAYSERMKANGSDEEPSLDNFLSDMTPQEKNAFLKKYDTQELKVDEDENVITTQYELEDKESDNSIKKDNNEKVEDAQDIERIRSQYSDQNEIMIDRVRVRVLQNMDKVDSTIDVDNLKIEDLLTEVEKADKLAGEDKAKYEKSVENELKHELLFGMAPPSALNAWDKRLSAEIKDTLDKDPKADLTNQEACLNAVHHRMDSLIKDMAEQTGIYFVDKTNIADAYDGYIGMIEQRNENPLGAQAKKVLDDKADEYDAVFGLKGKTSYDAKNLDNLAKDTSRKLKDFELSDENLVVAASLHFKDEKGNNVPQFLDDSGNPAMAGKKVRPGSQLETLIEASKSDALDDQILIEGKVATKEEIATAANDTFLLNATLLINSDKIGHKQKAVLFDVLEKDLKSGKAYDVTPEGFDGVTDEYVNRKTSKLARLGKHKIGNEAPVLGRLYEPIRKMDKLEKARFSETGDKDKYRKQFWTGLAANAVIVGGVSASFAVASKIPGAQPYCAAASVGLALGGMAYTIYRKKQQARAEGQKYGVKEFFKDKETMSAALLSGVSLAAMAWGHPELAMAAMAGNVVRTGYYTRKRSKQAGIGNKESWLMTLGAASTTPLAALGGREIGDTIANALGGPDGMFGHWHQTDGQTIPGEKTEIKTYDQKHIDKAETWNNSDGQHQGARYTADGSAPQESSFHKTGSYNDALSNVQANHGGWSPEAADVNMAKLENAHLLGAPNTPLAHDPSQTLGDIMGAVDPTTGEKVTYQDVFKHLTTNPQTPLSATESQVMDMVAQHMSADTNGHMGHLIPDVGIKTSDLYSFDQNRPDGIIHNVTQTEDVHVPGEKVWIENPKLDLVPYIPPYFITQVRKIKQMKEKIGALADRLMNKKKTVEQKPIVGAEPIEKPKPREGDYNFANLTDHVAGTGTSGTYNELDDYLPDDEKITNISGDTQPTYVLTDKDKESTEYSEALSKAMNGDANAIEACRKKREKALADIERAKNMDMSENPPKEQLRTQKEENAYQEKCSKDKDDFKKKGKFSDLMSLFKRKTR